MYHRIICFGEVYFFMRQKQRLALFGSLKILVLSSILAAISIVCGKYLAIPGGTVLRFSFENLPVLLSGVAFGPLVGAVVGAVADLIGSVMVGYTINPVVTLGAATVGLLGGAVFRLGRPLPPLARLTLTVTVAHLIGSVVVKTLGLAAFYALPLWELMLWRLLNYLIIGALELMLLWLLLRNEGIRRQLNIQKREKDGTADHDLR